MIDIMRKLTLFLLINVCSLVGAENIPDWIIPLRDAVYEQKLTSDEIRPLYQAAKRASNTRLTGSALNAALSRCEYFMGRALTWEKQNDRAISYYAEGMKLAEKAIDIEPSAEAWLIRSENLSQTCSLRSWAYAMANGLDVEKYARKALEFNKAYAAAYYLCAARWVYAPKPFDDVPKGIEMMHQILKDTKPDKDDLFNVYSSIGYGHMLRKNNDEARTWFLKSLEVYPTNKYVTDLLKNL